MYRNFLMSLMLAVLIGVLCASKHAVAETCVTNPQTGPDICVDWDEGADPEFQQDFDVFFTDEDYPDVELNKGSDTWRMWSVDTSNPDDIGDIGVISCPHAGDFSVSLIRPSGTDRSGARNVKAITLVPSSSSNYSNILDARITGDLSGEAV